MAFKTFAQLVQDVIASIGEVAGTSVQTYSEPRVEVALRHIFELCFRKVWWPQYCSWYERTLDGTLGVVTANLDIVDIRDIRCIIPSDQNKSIPLLPAFLNPYELTGTNVRYYEGLRNDNQYFETRLIQFWPKTATGGVKIHGRAMPTIVNDTVLYLDEKLLVNGAAWVILEDEDINPNAAALRERLFNEAFADIMKSYSDQPIEASQADYGSYLSEWQAP